MKQNLIRTVGIVLLSITLLRLSNAQETTIKWEKSITLESIDKLVAGGLGLVDSISDLNLIQDSSGGSVLSGHANIGQQSFEFLLHYDSESNLKWSWKGQGWSPYVMRASNKVIQLLSWTNEAENLLTVEYLPNGQTLQNTETITDTELQFLGNNERLYDTSVSTHCYCTLIKIDDKHYTIRKRSLLSTTSQKLAPVLFSGIDGQNAIISWPSEVGKTYQVQKSEDLTTWMNIGLPITGTGEPMHYSEANRSNKLYLRIVIP